MVNLYDLWCTCCCIVMVILDVEFGYPNRPLLFKDLNFGVDMDSRSMYELCTLCVVS